MNWLQFNEDHAPVTATDFVFDSSRISVEVVVNIVGGEVVRPIFVYDGEGYETIESLIDACHESIMEEAYEAFYTRKGELP